MTETIEIKGNKAYRDELVQRCVIFCADLSLIKIWCLMALPSSLVCGLLLGAWNYMTGQNVFLGMLGGVIGIVWSFLIIGIITWIYE